MFVCAAFLQQSAGQGLFYWFPEQRLQLLLADPEISCKTENCKKKNYTCLSLSFFVIYVCVCVCVCVCVHFSYLI